MRGVRAACHLLLLPGFIALLPSDLAKAPRSGFQTSDMTTPTFALLLLFLFLLSAASTVSGVPRPKWRTRVGRSCKMVKEVKYREETQKKCSTYIT